MKHLLLAALAALSLSAHATPEWKPDPAPTTTNAAAGGKAKADSKAGAVAGSTSGSTASTGPVRAAGGAAGAKSSTGPVAATSGPSTSGATAATGPSTAGASAGTGPISIDVQVAPAAATQAAPAGPVNVAPSQTTETHSSTRAIAISLPPPVSGVASATGCLVVGNSAHAIGWNFASTTGPKGASDPDCTLGLAEAAAAEACQWKTAAMIRAERVRRASGLALPVNEALVDMDPLQCIEARAPKVIVPPAPVITAVASGGAGGSLSQAQAQEQQPAPVTPPQRPRRDPPKEEQKQEQTTPAPACAAGQTMQCADPKPSPGSFGAIVGGGR